MTAMMGCFSEEEEEQKSLSPSHLMPTKFMTALRDELSFYVNKIRETETLYISYYLFK